MSADLLTAVEWQAARLAAGEDVPDASEEARALAARAVADADRPVMLDLAEAVAAGYTPSGKFGPRVSDFGGCGRRVWYRELPPEGYTPRKVDSAASTLGSVIHKAAESVRSVRYPWRRYEFEVPIPGLDKPGRIDEYDPVLGEVTDDKTASDAVWSMVGDNGPLPSAWGQGMIYGLALEELGLPVRTVRIIVINRGSGAEEPFRRDYDPAFARSCLDELLALGTLLDLGVTPIREGTGPGRFPCRFCEARDDCWNVQAAEAAGRSPESFTILGKDPEDGVVEWAALGLKSARAAATAAKKAKEEAESLLEGVPFRTYGRAELYPGGRDMPDYKASWLRLLDLYALPEEHRPAVDTVAEPIYRRDRWIGVRVERAAKKAARTRKKASDAEAAPQ